MLPWAHAAFRGNFAFQDDNAPPNSEGNIEFKPLTLGQLAAALTEEWAKIPVEGLHNFVRSMPRRLQAVINYRVGNTIN